MYLNQNKGLKAIANYLNKQGYHTINKKPFSVYGVKYILNNPVYKGYVRFNNYQNWAVERRSGKNDKSKVILVQGKHKSQWLKMKKYLIKSMMIFWMMTL